MEEIVELLKVYRPDEIAFVTYTRKGVNNGIDRICQLTGIKKEELTYFKTLHSMCFRELELKPKNMVNSRYMKKFNDILSMCVYLRSPNENQTSDDQLLTRYEVMRSGAKYGVFVHGMWNEEKYRRLIRAYEVFKDENSLIDFHDCLQRFIDKDKPVPVKVAFIDEAQDLSLLQWEVCKVAFSNCEKVRISGDDFQCQPGDNSVLTDKGYVLIKDLKKSDNVAVWDRRSQAFYGFRTRHYHAIKAKHHFSGMLQQVTCNGQTASFTPDHRMITRWAKRDTDWRCVYLMRRGNDYRIGQCQIFNKSGITHLSFRMRGENADGLWVLYLSKDKIDILVQEQVIATTFGLPQVCFTFRHEVADKVYEKLNTKASAIKCLAVFGLDINHPLLTDERITNQSGGTCIFECEAVNLIPEIMLLPVYSGSCKIMRWLSFSCQQVHYNGDVYRLDVEKYHTYITSGIVTHNCLFQYSGASPATLIALCNKYETIKLEVSYRLPKTVYEVAKSVTKIIEDKIDKDFKPVKKWTGFVEFIVDRHLLIRHINRDLNGIGNAEKEIGNAEMKKVKKENGNAEKKINNEGGNVRECESSVTEKKKAEKGNGYSPNRWYLLFRNNCFIEPIALMLEQFTLPYHTAKGFCLDDKLLAKVKRYYNYRKEGYSSKEVFDKFCKDNNIDDINNEFIESDLIPNERKYAYLDYINKFGVDALIEMSHKAPTILLSTTHKVKGGEADYVVVFLDCTRKVFDNKMINIDEELRVLYVACTRAKLGLYLASSNTRYGLDDVFDLVKEGVV
jgi:superfamily I DNA/RNA helicase